MRRLFLMFILTWGLLGFKCAQAQITFPYALTNDTMTVNKLTTCNGDPSNKSVLFTDDNTNDGNYADDRMRRDTVEICPTTTHDYVKVVITDFDLEDGDTLFAYDGTKAQFRMGTAPIIGTGAGVGVSKGFGGWVDASCDPKINPSGCLTFFFKTDGDNGKGTGWEAWVDCAALDISFGNVSIESRVLTKDSAAYGQILISAPEIKACNTTLPTTSDSVRLVVKSQLGVICIDTILTNAGTRKSVTDTFAIGVYSAEYTLLSDDKKKKVVPFSVQAPSLVCNDNIIVPFGSACLLQLRPDDVLESPVDTITDTMYYNITVTIGSGKNQVVKTTANFDNHGTVTYPTITVEDVKKAGMSICGAQAKVSIERIYYQLGGTETICNSGMQRTSCHGTISFTDQSKPFISTELSIDTLVSCDTTGIAALLKPVALDNCDSDVPVTISVVMDEKDPCFNNKGSRDTTQAIVTFTAVDDCGNVGTAERRITIIRPNEREHIAKTEDLTLDCTDTTFVGTMPGLKIGAYKNGEFLVNDTIALRTDQYFCGYILTRNDVEIPNTDCGRKVYRYWSVVDWCTPEVGPYAIDTQLVKFTDKKAPTFTREDTTTRVVPLGAFDCTFDITTLTPPEATDNCSTPRVRLDSVFRIEDGLPWPVAANLFKQLDADSFHLRWIAEDECHEQLVNDTTMQLLVIRDVTRPTAVCTDQLNISVGSNSTIIDTSDVDVGSYDACGIVNRTLSRDGENFGPQVIFTCEDVGKTIKVTLRITDTNGNTNDCWFDVNPEDKIRPICTAFPEGVTFANGDSVRLGLSNDVRINCNDSKVAAIQNRNSPTAMELAAIGGMLPLPVDNCPNVANIELTPRVIQAGFCGQDIYERRWIARDVGGLESVDTCTQRITINYEEDWTITLPKDDTLTCPVSEVVSDSVLLRNGTCDKLAVSVDTKMFDVVQDACFKIIKTYHIINWCNYQAGDAPTQQFNDQNIPADRMLTAVDVPNLSYITYTQVIKVDDNEGPIVIIPSEIDTCIRGKHDGKAETVGDSTSCGELKTFRAVATDCVTEVGGSLSYTYKLYSGTEQQVIDQQAMVVHQSDEAQTGNEATMSAIVLPGTYTAEFIFTDNCGNATLARTEHTFVECTPPTPYLLNGIAIEIAQSTASIEIWANDFDQGSFDNCTIKDSLKFRIWHISLGINPPETVEGVLDSLPTAITFNCNFLGTQIVRIYVIDERNNFDFASTFVLIQDNMRACQGDGNDPENMVAGDVTNHSGETIEDVRVKISGGGQNEMMTAADGHYEFSLAKNGNYTVTPEKNDNPLNGVSTFDLVLISKHILGITPFDSPYKYIAADVNKSGSITAFDMVQLRQVILNIKTEFPNNQSWRFVDKAYTFANENPITERFAETISIDNLTEDNMHRDFVGIKVGDINGNANTSSLLGAEERITAGTFGLQIADKLLTKGETVEVVVKAADLPNILGYQFTMHFEALELLRVEEGLAKKTNFNTQLANRGVLTTSWNGEGGGEETLFTLSFRAKTNGFLRDFLTISSEVTTAEAYNLSGEPMKVTLDFQDTDLPTVFKLHQNAPNPFNEETMISFVLPEAGVATLKIMDIQGRILTTIRGNYEKGYNRIHLDASSLGATGVLHYQLEAGNYLANKKMIIIE